MTHNAPSRLSQLRAASLAMLDGLSEAEQRAQSHPELSPLLWHVGHVFFVETYWLAERVFGDTQITDAWRALYFPELSPKESRAARLPDARAVSDWARHVSAGNDAYWQQLDMSHPLAADGYLAAFIRQHYAQHLETMRLARAQLAYAALDRSRPSKVWPAPPPSGRVTVNAGQVTLGTDTIEAYDNEQPPCSIHVDAFEIGRACVTNAQWLGFMEAGGYDDRTLWSEAGWQWRQQTNITHPQHWSCTSEHGWHVPSDEPDREPGAQPVHGIGWFEACAFAVYAGARLPREVEWEAARRADRLEDVHNVWEWCADAFYPYPGFRAFPYDGYSMPWFDGAHFIARGASRYSEADIKRPGFRNFYPPAHRHVCAGLRLAW